LALTAGQVKNFVNKLLFILMGEKSSSTAKMIESTRCPEQRGALILRSFKAKPPFHFFNHKYP
jgi:hypothetical protein